MNQMIKAETVNYKELVSKSTKLSLTIQSKLVDKLKNHFNEEEQRLYIANLYMYMNYNSTEEYPINLETVWKFAGYSNKANAKRLLKNNFTKEKDYKIVFIRTDENPKDEKNKDLGGRPEETIMLNINTFKKLCLRANTKEADKIHDYYVKLENIYNEVIKEEMEEQKKLLENTKDQLDKTKLQLEKTTKLVVKKWYDQEPGHTIYGFRSFKPKKIEDEDNIEEIETNEDQKEEIDNDDSLITIGKSKNIKKRESGYMTHNQTGEMFYIRKCYNCDLAEDVLHHILDKYRVERNKEWFDISEELTIYLIDTVCDFLDKFIGCSEKLQEFKIKEFFDSLDVPRNNYVYEPIQQVVEEDVDEVYEEEKIGKSSKYMGVLFYPSRQQWIARKTIRKKTYNLGYYETELDAAKAFNDYIMYVNNTFKTTFKFNKIQGYIPTPRNIPEESKNQQVVNKSSNYTGIHYDFTKNYYTAWITFNNERLYLGCNHIEDECAKLYNQQAMYFNENFETNFEINEIPNYVTVAKNIHQAHKKKLKDDKSSEWVGVNLTRNNKYRAYLKYDNKQRHIGGFDNQLDAAKAYNDYATYLNQTYDTNYIINKVPGYVPTPRNIIEDNKNSKHDRTITKYSGVSYNKIKNLYCAVITFNNRRYPLGYTKDEHEAGKLYNQQAMYFNEKFGTKYELNNITDYRTIAKNVHEEYEKNKQPKSSKYHGVSQLPDGRYIAILIFDKKQKKTR
jgi:hypothetical protein